MGETRQALLLFKIRVAPFVPKVVLGGLNEMCKVWCPSVLASFLEISQAHGLPIFKEPQSVLYHPLNT